MILRISLIFFLLSSFFSQAQTGPRFNFKQFTTRDGLPTSILDCIYQDHKGYLWIGSRAGISQFDGLHFKNFSTDNGLSNNEVSCITEDDKGNLWIGTSSGLNRFDGNKFSSFDSSDGLENTVIRSLLFDSNKKLYVGTSDGLFKLDGSRFKKITAEGINLKKIYCLLEKEKGIIWLGTGKNISEYNGKRFKEILISDSNRSTVYSMMKDPRGEIWITTFHKGLFKYVNNHFEAVSIPGQSDQIFLGTSLDNKGRIWIIKQDEIIILETGKYHFINLKDHIGNESVIMNIHSDREGNIWLASLQQGLFRLTESFVDHFTIKDGLHNNEISSAHISQNADLLFGSIGGLISRFDGKSFSPAFPGKPEQYGDFLNVLLDSKGKTWIGSPIDNLVVFDGKEYTEMIHPLFNSNYSRSTFEDKDGKVWIGTGHGAVIYDNEEFTEYGRNVGFDAIVLDMNQDRAGNLWFATDKGLFIKTKKGLINLTQKEFKKTIKINCFTKDDKGDIWVGSSGFGILHYVINSAGEINLNNTYTIKDGLPGNFIASMTFDRTNSLWVAFTNGISRIRFNSKNPEVRIFDENDGINVRSWFSNQLVTDKNGDVWAGTIEGVYRFRVNEIRKNVVLPRTYITSIRNPGENNHGWENPETIHGTALPLNLTLPYDNNNLSFSYTAISLSNPALVTFKYMLEGFDRTWHESTKERYVTYTNLPAGTYTFKVISSNNDGLWNQKAATYTFTINLPFWKTWWFSTIAGASLFLLVLGIMRYRINSVKKEEQRKTDFNEKIAGIRLMALRAQMNPHFIFNSLNSIQHFITNYDRESALMYLSKFAKLVRRILENSQNNAVLLSEEISMLHLYLELESLRFENRFIYKINIDSELDTENTKIPSLLIQPYVENSIIHGLMNKPCKGQINISMSKKENSILCVVEDDGIGRVKAEEIKRRKIQQYKSVGMTVTADRLDILNTHLNKSTSVNIHDLYSNENIASGTRVEILIPLESR